MLMAKPSRILIAEFLSLKVLKIRPQYCGYLSVILWMIIRRIVDICPKCFGQIL